jgi:hypothetical protein
MPWQLVQALRYKSKCRGFDSRFSYRNFSITSFRQPLGLTQSVTEMSQGGQRIELTNLRRSCAHCLEIWEPQTPGTLRACLGLQRDCFTFTIVAITLSRRTNGCSLGTFKQNNTKHSAFHIMTP